MQRGLIFLAKLISGGGVNSKRGVQFVETHCSVTLHYIISWDIMNNSLTQDQTAHIIDKYVHKLDSKGGSKLEYVGSKL